jgi:hypothetical protein
MRSRRSPLSVEFVGGLNLIEVEFFNDAHVLAAYRTLLSDLNIVVTSSNYDENRTAQNREYLRTVLLSAIAKSLRFNIPDLEIFRGGYTPQGHVNIDAEQAAIRTFLADIAAGRKSLPITAIVAPAPVTTPSEQPTGPTA